MMIFTQPCAPCTDEGDIIHNSVSIPETVFSWEFFDSSLNLLFDRIPSAEYIVVIILY